MGWYLKKYSLISLSLNKLTKKSFRFLCSCVVWRASSLVYVYVGMRSHGMNPNCSWTWPVQLFSNISIYVSVSILSLFMHTHTLLHSTYTAPSNILSKFTETFDKFRSSLSSQKQSPKPYWMCTAGSLHKYQPSSQQRSMFRGRRTG